MMERIKPEWVWVGCAFAAMILVPWLLLSNNPENVPDAQPILITNVTPQEIVTVDALIAKPIFNEQRKQMTAADELAAIEEPEAAVPVLPAPTLVGLVSKKRGKAVAIIKTNEGETITLKRGQSSDGWQLVSIGKNAATFASANKQKTIGLDYGNKAIGGPAGPQSRQENITETQIPDGEPN